MKQNALITGAGNRIGAAIALELAAAGHAIAVHFNRNRKGAEKVRDRIIAAGGRAIAVQADLSEPGQRNGLVSEAARELGPLGILINNASIYQPDSATTISEELWDRHFDIHARAPMFLIRDFAGQLPKNARGHVINMIDERVLRTDPSYFSYNLSKSVLWTATRTLAQSLAPDIRVNAIGPGPTLPHERQTRAQFEKSIARLPLQTSSTPGQIADAIMFLLATPSITGQMLALDGGEHLEWRGPARGRDATGK